MYTHPLRPDSALTGASASPTGGSNFLANVCSFSLLCVFICCLMFKVDILTAQPTIENYLSDEQRSDFQLESVALTALLFGCLFGNIAISACMLLERLASEQERHRLEELASKARRLRYRSNDVEVNVPKISSNEFHLFLSHVWGTGQDQMRIVKERLGSMVPDLRVFLE
jgi:hypothetical protein